KPACTGRAAPPSPSSTSLPNAPASATATTPPIRPKAQGRNAGGDRLRGPALLPAHRRRRERAADRGGALADLGRTELSAGSAESRRRPPVAHRRAGAARRR